MDDLGNAITNFCNQVPHGMVLFLPSYTFLDSLYARWNEKGTLKRINSKKKVSYVRIPISGSSLFLTRIPLFFPGLLGTEIFLGC